MLELDGVGVRRGAAWLLAEVDLVVLPGERWVVVGPNGAGKSTLLAVAATSLLPTVGRVRVLGAELGRVDARTLRPRIGLTSAALAERFDARLRAREVVVTARTGALAPWWDTYAERDQARALELLRQLGVGGVAERPFLHALHGGAPARAAGADPPGATRTLFSRTSPPRDSTSGRARSSWMPWPGRRRGRDRAASCS